MLKRFSTTFALFSLLLDLSLTAGVLTLAEYLRVTLPWGKPFVRDSYSPQALLGMVILIWGLVFTLLSVHGPRNTQRAGDEFRAVIVANCFACLVFAGTLYLTFREVSRLLFVYFVVLDTVVLLLWRLLARAFLRLCKARGFLARRVLVAGAGDLGHLVAAAIHEYAWTGLTLVGYLDDVCSEFDDGLSVLGALDDVEQVVRQYRVDELVVALPQHANEWLDKLLAELQLVSVNIRVVPDCLTKALFRATVEDFGGLPLISLREPVLKPYQRSMKRMLDLVIGSTALAMALPVIGLIAIAIKLDSSGSVFVRQRRVGENGRLFDLLKFRSMSDDIETRQGPVSEWMADGHMTHKAQDDPSVTRVGRFIRRTSLDELPQLLNVLKGEMSLVGPRPELPWLVQQDQAWRHKRLAVPQGITGWWRVNGRADKSMQEPTDEDLFYIQNYSLLLDLQILWKTVGAVLKRSDAS